MERSHAQGVSNGAKLGKMVILTTTHENKGKKMKKKKNFFLIFEVNLGKNIECNGLYQKKNEKVAYLWKKWGKMTKK